MAAEHDTFNETYWTALEALSEPLTAVLMFEPVVDTQGQLTDFRYKLVNRHYLSLTGQNEQAFTETTLRAADPTLVESGAVSALAKAVTSGVPNTFATSWPSTAGIVGYTATAFRVGRNAVLICRPDVAASGPDDKTRHVAADTE